MSRWSPTVRDLGPDPLVAALEGLYYGGRDAVQRNKESEERDRQRSIEDFDLRSSIDADPRYTTERPNQTPRLADIFQGERPGKAAGASPRPSPTFGGMGMQPTPPAQGFAEMVGGLAPQAGGDKPRYLPGQYVRDAGMFTERPVFDIPKIPKAIDPSMVAQPEPVAPYATVAGLDVFRDPGYRTEKQQKKQDLAAMVDLLGRGRGGDQGALDELLATDRDVYEALNPKPTAPVRGSQEYLDALDAEEAVRARYKDAQGTGSDTTTQDRITERGMVMSAINALMSAGQYNDTSTPAGAARYNAEVRRILQAGGWESVEEVQELARSLRSRSRRTPSQGASPSEDIQDLPTGAEDPDALAQEVESISAPQQRRDITRDEADYLREVRGMSEEEISRLYRIR